MKQIVNVFNTNNRVEIIKYKISCDGKGLLAYWNNKNFYHIHSDELTKLEKWILKILKKLEIKETKNRK